MPSMLPVSSACSDIRRRGEFVEHPPRCKRSRLCFVRPLCAPISVLKVARVVPQKLRVALDQANVS